MMLSRKAIVLWAVTVAVVGEVIPPMIDVPGVGGGARPEVVLQLQYGGGALDRVYLAQYRQGSQSVVSPTRMSLCSSLCHAGLGGAGCGESCKELVPVGLEAALQGEHNSGSLRGEPRTSVCPTLCANQLGEPLCNCAKVELEDEATPDWSAVCGAFCRADHYLLGGCPVCDASASTEISEVRGRALSTSEGWAAWCNVQCRQGQGGAACNCDRSPFQ